MHMRTAVYLRLSQDRAGDELGVDRQREACAQLAATRGWNVVAVHTDNDLSATKGRKRPGYLALMDQIKAGQLDAVVVYMTSRLWRNRRERAEGIDVFREHRVRLVPVRGPEIDCSSAGGRMVAGILGELDTAEVDIKSERQQDEVRQRAKQGRPHGGPRMFGVAADNRTLVEAEAEQLRAWFGLLLAGGSVSSIVRASGRPHSSVRKMLRNPRNAGLRILDGQTYPASNPAIVTETVWRAVVGILDGADRRTSFTNSHRHLGSGVYQCACGKGVNIAYSSWNGRTYRRYRCADCGRSWTAQRIDDYVEDVVAEWLRRHGSKLPTFEPHDPAAALASEAAAVRRRIEQTRDAFTADPDTDPADLVAALRGLRTQLADIEARMKADQSAGALAALVAADDPVAEWRKLKDAPRRKAIVRALMTVTLQPTERGAVWDPEAVVKVTWR